MRLTNKFVNLRVDYSRNTSILAFSNSKQT
ncbi:MAG: hypothetical protein K0R51_2012, partial [Cytophagaceae bacterium]|nr:hypothetical protein [Cytophagaceae bacterium]